MQIIPISATPSQTLAVVLAGQSCKINIYQKNTGLFVDLYVNDALIIGGVIALDRNRIVRSAYLGFVGDLAFVDTQGSDTPVYDGLGGRYLLLYLDPADTVAPTFDVKFFTPLITPITGFAAVGGFEENTLDWDMVNGFTYDLYWSLSAGITPSTGTKIAGVSASYVHTGLEDGTRYYYVLVATDANGGISVSDTVDAITIPAAPLNLVAVGGSMQETLTWNAAVGAASYNLYWSDAPGVTPETGTAIVGATSGHVLSGLLNAKQYYFVVTAVNESGEGPPSAQANAATSTLAAPTGLAAVGGANEVTTSWTSIGGLTYNLYWSLTTGVTPLTGTKIAGVRSPHVHGSLANGTQYFYVLTAQNAGGESAASAQVNGLTFNVPGAPTIGTATAGNAQASVTFSAPASDGGSAITGYTVTSSPGAHTGTGAASPIVVTGLTNGTAYTFTVTATNAVGTGAASAASNSVTPIVPTVPATFDPSAKSTRITLSNVNLTATCDGTTHFQVAKASVYKSTGKWGCEFHVDAVGTVCNIGLANSAASVDSVLGFDLNSYSYQSDNGSFKHNNSTIGSGTSYGTNKIITVLFDADADTITFWEDGTPQGTPFTDAAGSWTPAFSGFGAATIITANFGASAFVHALPAGYSGWSS